MKDFMRIVVLFGILLGLAAPAFASGCPGVVKQIDEKLTTVELSEDQRAEVMALRDEGEELHKEGNHGESMEKLKQALEMLGG